MKILLGGALIGLLLATLAAGGEKPGQNLASLVEAEQAFSRLSESNGMRDAFLANLAEDSVVFQPGPVNGRKAYANSPNVPAMLVWKPLYADISKAGDVGYTTGPWTFNTEKQEKIHGDYVTIWKKRGQDWKVLLDCGVSHPPSPENGGDWSFPEPQPAVSAEGPSVMDADRAFSKDAGEKGFLDALLTRAAPTIRVYRPGAFPIVGTEAVAEALSGEPGSWVWEPLGGEAARSGDLGYTYGLSHAREGSVNPAPGATNSYLRIWKRDNQGVWTVVLDLANPLPTQPESKP